MARSYAQFSTAMWRNADFLALPAALQRVYMMLSSQADISAVGVLPLSITRWARRAPDTTQADIVRALDGLAERRFIVYDRDSEEVLVRSFLRWDNGYKNPKRLPAIRDAADEVESPAIVAALAAEFARLEIADKHRGQCVGGAAPAHHEIRSDSEVEDAFPQVDSLSIAYSAEREGVSRSERRVPQPPTPNPHPVPPSAANASASAVQGELAHMPEPDATVETPTQIAFRLARAWIKLRADEKTPVVARGKADPAIPLKNVIEPAIKAGYFEHEVNDALKRCDKGIPSATQFESALTDVRKDRPSWPTKNHNGRRSDVPHNFLADSRAPGRDYSERL